MSEPDDIEQNPDDLIPEKELVPLAVFVQGRVRASVWEDSPGVLGMVFDCCSCDCPDCIDQFLVIFAPEDLKDLLVVMRRAKRWCSDRIFGELNDEDCELG